MINDLIKKHQLDQRGELQQSKTGQWPFYFHLEIRVTQLENHQFPVSFNFVSSPK